MFNLMFPQLSFQFKRHRAFGKIAVIDAIAIVRSKMFVQIVALRKSAIASGNSANPGSLCKESKFIELNL